ncbi:hypothetical protein D6D22_03400 [Aureobasidium pullulans]|uniref:Uncharacterized protein n=1 Tax=Aureobasidium pullulans TaxID=5580 RepID=A0A4S8Y2J6_AURPU|nr:hypothetical protein D6D22_03400 [Aureobasidium pullulans]
MDVVLNHCSKLADNGSDQPKFTAFPQLPTELQLLICKNAVTRPEPIDLSKRENHRLPDITRTSKLFHAEGSRLYYQENTFLIPLPSRLAQEENIFLDCWLCDSSTTETVAKMGQTNVQISLPPDRASLANLLLLAVHFGKSSSIEAKKTVVLQPVITLPRRYNLIIPLPAVTTELQDQISNAFWRIFDTSMHELATGTYKIVWADEEEMEMNAGVPLLERAVALGRICEELWSAIMTVWNPGQDRVESQYEISKTVERSICSSTKSYKMALPAEQKRLALRLLNLEAEYTVLTAINPATRTYEEDARIKELDFLCLAHGLPSEVKNNVLEYYIPGLEPVDIADPANHTRPTWCTDNEAEFLYWRHTRFIFRTDDLTRTNLDNKINAAQTFIQNNLRSTTHPARLFYMQPKKKVIFEIYLKIDLSVGGAAEIDDENLEALWRLLELLNGEMGHLQLKFIWKNDTNPNDLSAATKREVATNNSGPFVAIEQNLLTIVLAAARHYTTCMHAPATINSIKRWA